MKASIRNIRFLTILFSVLFIASFYSDRIILSKHALQKSLVSFLTPELKRKIKKYLLPYNQIEILENKIISLNRHEKVIEKLSMYAVENDFRIKDALVNLKFLKSQDQLNFSGDKVTLFKFQSVGDSILSGINKKTPGSAYLENYKDRLFLLSSIGILGYSEDNYSELNFRQIKNNLSNYISEEQIKESNGVSFKDLLIYEEKIFISFTNELRPDCWNTSILYGDLDYKEINFKPLFFPKECINSINNRDNLFNVVQSGGRLVVFDNENILLSTGEFRSRHLAQNKESIHGKILKINIKKKDYKIISMGHRNIQGLLYDKDNQIIISTEHGPRGGDEINLLPLVKLLENKIPNYGWAISSYGEHYIQTDRNQLGWTSQDSDKSYKNYPLYKSHKNYGFIEPIKYYTPSIGISEVISINTKNKVYLHSSLRDKSLHLFILDEQNKVIKISRILVNERIRDMIRSKNKIILFLEDTASIGVINIDDLYYP